MKHYGFQVERGANSGRLFIHATRPAPGGEFNMQERWLTREEAFDLACALIGGAQKLERGVMYGRPANEETRETEGSRENQEDDPLAPGALGGDQDGGG